MLTRHGQMAMVLTVAMGSGGLAQDSTVADPTGGTAAVTPDATDAETGAHGAVIALSDYPVLNQDMDDATIIDTLTAKGFDNLFVMREGPMLNVLGSRAGKDTKLVYNIVEGRLIEVDGKPVPAGDEKAASDVGAEDSGTAGGAGDDASGGEDPDQ